MNSHIVYIKCGIFSDYNEDDTSFCKIALYWVCGIEKQKNRTTCEIEVCLLSIKLYIPNS